MEQEDELEGDGEDYQTLNLITVRTAHFCIFMVCYTTWYRRKRKNKVLDKHLQCVVCHT